jgi:hypothetical protein
MISQDIPKPVPTAPTSPADLSRLFHQLNNHLGIILANAELLENRLSDGTHRLRAGQVISSALDAIATVRRLRQAAEAGQEPESTP